MHKERCDECRKIYDTNQMIETDRNHYGDNLVYWFCSVICKINFEHRRFK